KASGGSAVPAETGSVHALASEALRAGDVSAARALTGQILTEAVEARELFPSFINRVRTLLLAHGLAPAELELEERRLGTLLDPGGEGLDTAAAWRSLQAGAREALRRCAEGSGDEAAALLEQARRSWCAAHDRACDWIYGLLDAAFRRLGEDVIGSKWDAIMSDFYATRRAYSPPARPRSHPGPA